MTAVQLGASPETLSVTLVEGADFISALDSADGDWPDSAVIALTFDDADETTWTATTTGAAAEWNVDKAAVDALILAAGNRLSARLTYTDGATDLVWAEGRAMIRRRP